MALWPKAQGWARTKALSLTQPLAVGPWPLGLPIGARPGLFGRARHTRKRRPHSCHRDERVVPHAVVHANHAGTRGISALFLCFARIRARFACEVRGARFF